MKEALLGASCHLAIEVVFVEMDRGSNLEPNVSKVDALTLTLQHPLPPGNPSYHRLKTVFEGFLSIQLCFETKF